MKAAVLKKYRKFSWENVPTPVINKHEVLLKVEYAGICGSDMHIFNGDFHPRTKIPMIPGHEFTGTIVEKGEDVHNFNKGDKVSVDPIIWCGKCAACQQGHYPACTSLKLIGVDLDGGFGEFVAVPENMLYRLPENISLKDAALIEYYSIGFHACQRADLKENDTVVIWGTGRIGHSILQAARTKTRNTVICIDIIESRLEIARKAYPDVITINLSQQDPIAVINDVTDGRGVDIAFEAVGHAKAVPDWPNPVRGCVKSIRGAGTVCVLGLGDELTPILMKELIWKEAIIVASRVNHGEFSEVIKNLGEGNLKPEILVSVELHAKEAQKAFEMLEMEPENYLKILLKIS